MKNKRYEAPRRQVQMDAAQAVSYIEGKSGNGKKAGLSNTVRLLRRLGNPEEYYGKIHVAGTNGKGSTCAYLESCLREGGFHTGMYTSPYLERYNERICIDGQPVSDELLGLSAGIVRAQAEEMERLGEGSPTFFELGTATAFVAFALSGVDIAVIEVGLGGRLDSTNVIRPLVSAIAHIGLDHVRTLGNSLDEIAFEKAGIVKTGVPLVLYPQEESVRYTVAEVCRLREAPLRDLARAEITRDPKDPQVFSLRFAGKNLDGIRISLLGEHQIRNAALAVAVLWQLEGTRFALSEEVIRRGMEKASWHGRLEYLHPRLLIDGAHNPQAARVLADYLETLGDRPVTLVTAMMRDKDYRKVAEILSPRIRSAYCTCADARRGLPAAELAEVYRACGVPAETEDGAMPAVKRALREAGKDGLVLVAGSLYLSGEVRRRFPELKTLYISDLDGTLLRKDGTLSETTVRELNGLLDGGLLFSAATARSPFTAAKLLKPLHLKEPLILMNGVMLYDAGKGEPVYAARIEKESFLHAASRAGERGLHASAYILRGKELLCCYEEMNETERMDAETQKREYGKRFLHVPDFAALAEEEVIFVSVRDTRENVLALREDLSRDAGLSLTSYQDVYSDTMWYLEICGKDADKQSAALRLMELTDASFLEVFGDNDNDLPLFAVADRSYAVANAVESVRSRCTEEIPSNMEDGVVRKLKRRFAP